MGKGVFHLYRYAEVSKSANESCLGGIIGSCTPTRSHKRIGATCSTCPGWTKPSHRINPLSPEVTRVFEAVLNGAHDINGFRNKDLRNLLFGDNAGSSEELKTASSKITRIIRKLRAHCLISKIPRSTRYKVTQKGYRILGASLEMKKKYLPTNMKNAA